MKALFKNNIVTNPKGWAEKAVGTLLLYRVMQTFTVIAWSLYAVLLFMISNHERLPVILTISVIATFFAPMVFFPLCILRALRFYVLKYKADAV
jgi:hypothetical protein